MLGGQQTLQGQSAAREAAAEQTSANDAALQRQLDTIGQYSSDYAAEANRRQTSTDTTDDALIPYLRAASNAKAAAMQSAQSTQQQEVYKQATDMFKQLGVANGWIATALGIPEGATTADYQKILYDVNKPYYSPNTGVSSKKTPSISELLAIGKANGVFPPGLESFGINVGDPYYKEAEKIKDPAISLAAAKSQIKSILGAVYDSSGDLVNIPDVDSALLALDEMLESGQISDVERTSIINGNPLLKERMDSLSGSSLIGQNNATR
jgi:hypothetical protein